MPDLHEVVASFGFGWVHIQQLLLGGGTYAADGAELLLIGSVTKAVNIEWNLNATQRGAIISIIFIGVCIGNLLSGYLGDVYGRRPPILYSYAGVFVFSIISIGAWDFWSMTFARIFVGTAFGVGIPAWNALSGEICDSHHRVLMNALGLCMFSLGEFYSGFLIYMQDPEMKDLDWRVLIAWGTVPSVLLLVPAFFYLLESPRYYAVKGKIPEAQQVLAEMGRRNGHGFQEGLMINVQFDPPAPPEEHKTDLDELAHKCSIVFGRTFLYSTLVTCLNCFALNFLFYGGLYAFPQVLPELELRVSPAANLMIGAVWELPGYALALAFVNTKRKTGILVYLTGACVSTLLFVTGASRLGGGEITWDVEVMCQAGFIGNKFFTSYGFLVVYLYSMEIYPTVARTTGTALCIASGRLGSIICPLVYENLTEATGHFASYFYLMCVICVVTGVLSIFLPFDYAGEKLPDHHEAEPLKP